VAEDREVVFVPPGASRTAGVVVLKATGQDTAGAYALRENVMQPGQGPGPHRHDAVDEAWYVLEGTMTFLAGTEVIEVPAGGFVLVPRGVTHAFTNRHDEAARFLVLFSPPGLETMFEELHELQQSSSGGVDPQVRAALQARYGTKTVEVPPGIWPPA
jgi:quercetin dioxygenase-like cupin family protein